MLYRCPACRTPIQSDDRPQVGAIYRCHVCRLSLQINPKTDLLTIAPLDADTDDLAFSQPLPEPPRLRVIPQLITGKSKARRK